MSQLFTIYSPKGEKFEVSKPNFHDLRTHYGWSPQPPVADTSTVAVATATVEPKVEEPAPDEQVVETAPETDEADAPVDEKSALIAELKDRFGFEADKRQNVIKLRMKRDELAAAAEAGE